MFASRSCAQTRKRLTRAFTPLVTTLIVTCSLTGCATGGASSSAAQTTATTSSTASVGTSAPAQSIATPSPSPSPRPSPVPLAPVAAVGQPLDGITATQRKQHLDGATHFTTVETVPRLGPLFNGRSCAECHTAPTVGGGGSQRVTRFGRVVNGVFDPMTAQGGGLLQRFAIAGWAAEIVPPEATLTGQRRTTATYGFGLFEAIADADITACADRQKVDTPAQAGTPNLVKSASDGKTHVGRFGWKCQSAKLVDFAANAMIRGREPPQRASDTR
ncbi:MAG: hypothetical protein EB084_21295 [Proteobacteria bacterium]|nr:hypothetical protein [Pseudomonadota bacterium]